MCQLDMDKFPPSPILPCCVVTQTKMEDEERQEPHDEDPTTRQVTFTRGTGGFGFKIKGLVHGDSSMEVVMQVINGRFYAPLQYVSGVDKGKNFFVCYSRSPCKLVYV